MNNVNSKHVIDGLQKLNQEDETARGLFAWFSDRQKASKEMPVRVAAFRTGKAEWEIRRVFKKLDDLGCGHLVKGSRGHETRMVWDSNILSIAEVARGGSNKVDSTIPEDQPKLEEEETIQPIPQIPGGYIAHKFQLRRDAMIEVALPADFTSVEAERLAAFIKTLPFD